MNDCKLRTLTAERSQNYWILTVGKRPISPASKYDSKRASTHKKSNNRIKEENYLKEGRGKNRKPSCQ